MRKVSSAGLNVKSGRLTAILQQHEKAVLAFSGGVDSSFLLHAMKEADMDVLAVIGASETLPGEDLAHARLFAREAGATLRIIESEELSNPSFRSNPPDRCYFCKDGLFRRIRDIARAERIDAIFDGTNADDLGDYRPGRRAAELHGVQSPLAEAGLTKEEIRSLAREKGLRFWNRPSSPCLASRFPYGEVITAEALRRVEQAEQYLKELGIPIVRVRSQGDTARIEVDGEFIPVVTDPDRRGLIMEKFRRLGYRYVSVDLEGYRPGSLNRVLEDGKHVQKTLRTVP